MSVSVPSRRLAARCLFCQDLPIRPRVQHQQQRTALFGRGKKDDSQQNAQPSAKSNPILEEFQRRNPQTAGQTQQPQQRPQPGDLAASSIFEDDRRAQVQQEQLAAERAGDGDGNEVKAAARDPQHMLRALDPDPNARERWERKKVIQMVRKGSRLSKQQVIKRTEREHLLRSHNIKTSIKKLGMVARQIQGKTIEDAITQMRFSKKKVALEVLKQLEFARDEAVVMRGMGLGSASPEEAINAVEPESTALVTRTKTPATVAAPMQIQLKDGKRHTVASPATIYVDQAWVGRGPFGQLPDYRARGKVNIMRTPWTSLTVLLKEEATRVREYEEREDKRKQESLGKGLWAPLPDRPVQWQRQWYCF